MTAAGTPDLVALRAEMRARTDALMIDRSPQLCAPQCTVTFFHHGEGCEAAAQTTYEFLKLLKRSNVTAVLDADAATIERLTRERDDIATYAMLLQIALTGLAGGGSENFVRHGDGFRADISACTTKVAQRQTETMECVKRFLREAKAERARAEAAESRLAELTAELETARGRVAEMAAALEPFAMVAVHDVGTDETDADLYRPTQYHLVDLITIGHLRRAARVLAEHAARKVEGDGGGADG